jgi:predicted nuclease with TOPRIM domain
LIGSTNSLQQNRHSAALSRSRKKDYLQQIEKELNELREEHAQLNEQLKQRTLRVRELEAQLGISTSANELEDVMDKDKDKVADDYAK